MGTVPKSSSCRPQWAILASVIVFLFFALLNERSFLSSWGSSNMLQSAVNILRTQPSDSGNLMPDAGGGKTVVDPHDPGDKVVPVTAPLGSDPYDRAKAKFQQDLQSAGPLAVLTPRHPPSPLELRPSPPCKAGKQLRVFLNLNKIYRARFSAAIWSRPAMAKYGFVPASTEAEGDVFIFGIERKLPQVTELVRKGKKVVLFAKTDDVTRGSDAEELEHPNFLGIFKEFVYRSLGDYLEPRWGGRALSFHICDSPTFKQKPCCNITLHGGNKTIYLTEKFRPAWAKVRSVNWNWEQYYGIMKYFTPQMKESSSKLLHNSRDIDVFMAVHLRDEPGSYARAQVVAQMQNYKGPKELHLCKSKEGAAAFPNLPNVCLTAKQYSGYLRRTKIVVCPWGFGERTSCEHGGWASGAVVIKPWTDFVVAFPDMYRNGATYVAVEPDYHDLEEKVSHIATNWGSYLTMRSSAQKLFFKDVNLEAFVDHFWAMMCDLNHGSHK